MDDKWIAWFCGLVDGEGCFLLNWAKSNGVISPHFRVGMTESEMPILEEVMSILGCGAIYIDGFVGVTRSRPKAVYTITGYKTIVSKLIPVIDQYGLKTNKRKDYEVWKRFVLRWNSDFLEKIHHDREWGISMVNELRETRSGIKGASSRKHVIYEA